MFRLFDTLMTAPEEGRTEEAIPIANALLRWKYCEMSARLGT